MYDLSGLYYQMKRDGIIFGLVGLQFLISSRFWIAERRNVKEMIVGIVSILLCVCSLTYHTYVIYDLEIAVHEGALVRENRSNPGLFCKEYCFTNENGLKPVFYLDIFSKKELYPDDLVKGTQYRIFYEEKTDIIVKIEKLE